MKKKIFLGLVFLFLFIGIFSGVDAVDDRRDPNVWVDVTPTGTIVFPVEGGILNYNIALGNLESTNQEVDLWVVITTPTGLTYTVLGPVYDFTLQPGVSINRDETVTISARAPAGEYTLYAYVGEYYETNPPIIYSEDQFNFIKQS
ncbi:MAG: hypothetical protein V1663_03845 [archaeon]